MRILSYNNITVATYASIEKWVRNWLKVSVRQARRLMRDVKYGSGSAIPIGGCVHASVDYWGNWVIC